MNEQEAAELAAHIESCVVRIPFSGCWIWLKSTDKGYGQLTFRGKVMKAHRANWIANNPDKPLPVFVCHDCDVRECVNPDHLYAGDATTNRADALARHRWGHPYAARESCSAGHVYADGSGYRIASDGSRVCRECMKNHQRAFRAKKGA